MKKKPKTLEEQKKEVTFFPVQRWDDLSVKMKEFARSQSKQIPWEDTNQFCHTSLPKGKYDIDYVIRLLKIIIEQCDYHQLNRYDLPMSLRESCKKLIAYLNTEKLGGSEDPRIMITCSECGESSVVPRRFADVWNCPCNKNQKLLD